MNSRGQHGLVKGQRTASGTNHRASATGIDQPRKFERSSLRVQGNDDRTDLRDRQEAFDELDAIGQVECNAVTAAKAQFEKDIRISIHLLICLTVGAFNAHASAHILENEEAAFWGCINRILPDVAQISARVNLIPNRHESVLFGELDGTGGLETLDIRI